MKPLELLKQKLMIKPTIKENEPVIVAINVEKQETQETQDEIKNKPSQKTLIIDETNKGYNREELFKKLTENNLMKVKTKPVLEKIKEKEVIEPISQIPQIPIEPEQEPKKAKKIQIKNVFSAFG
jgi:hypothetical protein